MTTNNHITTEINFTFIFDQINQTENEEQLIKIGSDYASYVQQLLIDYHTKHQDEINASLEKKIGIVISSAKQCEMTRKVEGMFQTIHSPFQSTSMDALQKLMNDRESQDNINTLLYFVAENIQTIPVDVLEKCFKIKLNQSYPSKLLLTELLERDSSLFDTLQLEKKELTLKFLSNTTVIAFFVFILWEEKLKDILKALNDACDQLPLFFKYYLSAYHPIQKKPLKKLTEPELVTFIQDFAFVYTQYPATFIKELKKNPLHIIWKKEFTNPKKLLAKAILSIIFPAIDSTHLAKYTDVLFKHMQMHGLDELIPCIAGTKPFIEYLAQRSEWADPTSTKLLDLAILYRSPVTPGALDWSIGMQNKTMLKKLCTKGVIPKLSTLERIPILNRLANCQNKDILQLYFDYIGDAQDACLESMILNRQTLAIRCFLENGYLFGNEDFGNLLLNKSVQTYNVECICLIFENLQKQFPDRPISFPLLFPEDTEENTKDRLLQFALASPLSTLKRVIDTYYSHLPLKKWLEEMADILALQARLPRPLSNNDLHRIKKFAEINKTYLDDLVPKLPQLSWREFLKECLEKRKRNPDDHPPDKLIFRTHAEKQYLHTSLARSENDFFVETYYILAWHQTHVLTASLPYDLSSQSRNGDHITFSYRLPNNKLVKTNRLYTENTCYPEKIYWYHAGCRTIEKCQTHLNSLHRQVVEFPLTKDNRQEFEQLVAECYWLMSTLAETARGSAHNAKLWLLAVYRHHSLPPPIPKLEYFFVDTLMMCMTVDQAKILWYQFFEKDEQ